MSWVIDPKTGDYVMTNGAPVESTSLIYPAYYRLKVERTQWLYAPDVNYGSDFYTIKKRFTATDANVLTNLAERALQPMIDDGRASVIDATFLAPKSINDSELQVDITDAQGQPQVLNLPVIGV